MSEQPGYRVLVCEGRRCVPVLDLTGEPVAEGEAVTFLAEVAARLRALRALGRVVLVDGRTGRRAASVRVGPRFRRSDR